MRYSCVIILSLGKQFCVFKAESNGRGIYVLRWNDKRLWAYILYYTLANSFKESQSLTVMYF
jgi:hypothetical protein